jgi:pimeloyl-ACP methyl ester carboxylesterase
LTVIKGWDPRGVGASEPKVTCFNDTSQELFYSQLADIALKVGGTETTGNFTDPDVLRHFYSTESFYDYYYSTIGSTCYSTHGDALKYISTTSAVRDMIAISDSLGETSQLINYWGLSYGTGELAFLLI